MNEYLVSADFVISQGKMNRRADGAIWSNVWQGYCWRDENGVMHVDPAAQVDIDSALSDVRTAAARLREAEADFNANIRHACSLGIPDTVVCRAAGTSNMSIARRKRRGDPRPISKAAK